MSNQMTIVVNTIVAKKLDSLLRYDIRLQQISEASLIEKYYRNSYPQAAIEVINSSNEIEICAKLTEEYAINTVISDIGGGSYKVALDKIKDGVRMEVGKDETFRFKDLQEMIDNMVGRINLKQEKGVENYPKGVVTGTVIWKIEAYLYQNGLLDKQIALASHVEHFYSTYPNVDVEISYNTEHINVRAILSERYAVETHITCLPSNEYTIVLDERGKGTVLTYSVSSFEEMKNFIDSFVNKYGY